MKGSKEDVSLEGAAGPDSNLIDSRQIEPVPGGASEQGFSRRGFLKILGAGAATGAVGCAPDKHEEIVARVKSDGRQIPGVATWYASSCGECAAGCGVLAKSIDGRVIKVEGNPVAPVNQGKLCALGQSSLQNLYDPDRIRQPLKRELDPDTNKPKFVPVSWKEAYSVVARGLRKQGKKNVLLSGELSGTKQQLVDSWQESGSLNQVVFDFMQPELLQQATKAVVGLDVIPNLHFDKAQVVLSLGCDFLETWLSPVEFAADWASRRNEQVGSKLIQVEPRLSLTGANADQWLQCKPGSEITFIQVVTKKLIESGKGKHLDAELLKAIKTSLGSLGVDQASRITDIPKEKILLVIEALKAADSSLVVAGVSSSGTSNGLQVMIATQLLNLVLNNFGLTVEDHAQHHVHTLTFDKIRKVSSSFAGVRSLLDELGKSSINTLIVHGTNPVFSLPSSFEVKEAIRKADLVVALSSHLDETTELADYVLPVHTTLEDWGDVTVVTGSYGLVQPSMSPVFDTRPVGDILLKLAKDAGVDVGSSAVDFSEYLKESWQKLHQNKSWPEDFEAFWRKALEDGGVFTNEVESLEINSNPSLDFERLWGDATFSHRGGESSDLILVPFVNAKGYDGRAANRSWLQELPDVLSSIVWDTWAEVNPATAKSLGIETGDPLTIRTHYGELNIPAWVTSTVHAGAVAVPIGQGHSALGRYAQSVGGGNVLDLLPLSDKDAAGLHSITSRVAITRARGRSSLVALSGSRSQRDRHLARQKTVEVAHSSHAENHGHNADQGHGHAAHGHHEPKQMYNQRVHPLYEWGMVVDLASCTGCSACVVACYAENNIPTVGKRLCGKGREMSWLRIESYIDSQEGEDLEVNLLPLMCQHCNNAPCEPVCPVYATYHNEEGMNIMVYNRCVGTRYCSNNCSYKVRRFNWVEMEWPEPLDWQLNPNVTKRGAGVMEKCTFCVQRLTEAKDNAKDQGRLVRDGEVQPACVQSCPTSALTFGNLNDHKSSVYKMAKNDRAYKILDHHLNTQPSVSYLERLKFKV